MINDRKDINFKLANEERKHKESKKERKKERKKEKVCKKKLNLLIHVSDKSDGETRIFFQTKGLYFVMVRCQSLKQFYNGKNGTR